MPDIVAVTDATTRAVAAFAARGMRAASLTTGDGGGENVAVLWRADIAVEATDRFSLGQSGAAAGAVRITFEHAGVPVNVFCARLSTDPAVGVGQQARLGGLIDASRGAALAACENVLAQTGVRWSRCDDAWLQAERRFLALPAGADIGVIARSAFGLTPIAVADFAAKAPGPHWYCSADFIVLESRSTASSRSDAAALRFAEIALKSALSDAQVVVAL